MTKAEIRARLNHIRLAGGELGTHMLDRLIAEIDADLAGVRTAWGNVPIDHPPPTVATSEGPKPRIDLVAEGRPEPNSDLKIDRLHIAETVRRLGWRVELLESVVNANHRLVPLDQHERDIKALSDAVVELRNRLDTPPPVRVADGFVLRSNREALEQADRELAARLDALEQRLTAHQAVCDENADAINTNFASLARSNRHR